MIMRAGDRRPAVLLENQCKHGPQTAFAAVVSAQMKTMY